MNKRCLVTLIVASSSLAACLEPSQTTCATPAGERWCSAGQVCQADECVWPSQLSACDGVADNGQCRVDDLGIIGRCGAGVCQAVLCGDGRIGPGEACDDGNSTDGDGCAATCISDETCGNGVIDRIKGEQCDDANGVAGDGCSATCIPEICGNGVIDANEACDDGNTTSLDGCDAQCRSTEVCGNQRIDDALGEQCDSGVPGLAHDGCSSNCQLEVPSWTSTPLATFTARFGVAGAYDAARNEVVVFGGENTGVLLNDTWRYRPNVRRLERIALSHAPAARVHHSLVYDPQRQRIVLFGGRAQGRFLNDTWEFDGLVWRQIATPTAPPGRYTHAATYDVVAQRVVMIGGLGNNGDSLADMWTFDGRTWTQIASGRGPSGPAKAVYDIARARLIVATSNTIAEWDGTTWRSTPHDTGAPAAAYYDLALNQSKLMFAKPAQAMVLGTWDGTALTTITTDARSWIDAASAYLPAQQRLAVIAGAAFDLGQANLADTRLYANNGTSTDGIARTAKRVGRSAGHAMDPRTGSMLIAGGSATTRMGDVIEIAQLSDAWMFHDGNAEQVMPLFSVPAFNTVAFDRVRGQFALLGLAFTPGFYFLTPSGWQAPPSPPPPNLSEYTKMVYDEARSVLVAYDPVQQQLWEFRNASWTQVPLIMPPSQRLEIGLAFDVTRNRIVMFGGRFGGQSLMETWVLDGEWQPLATTQAPSNLNGVTMVGAGPLGLITIGLPVGSETQEVWQLRDTSWRRLAPATLPPARSAPALGYDPVRNQILMYGGQGRLAAIDDFHTFALQRFDEAPDRCEQFDLDSDGDGLLGCGALAADDPLTTVDETTLRADPDCWARCTPQCVPLDVTWPANCNASARRCGDSVCDAPTEDKWICPQDCP